MINPDNIIASSLTPGFGYNNMLHTNISISGSIPNGGKDFTGSISTTGDLFSIGFYSVDGSTIVSPTDKSEVGNGYSGVDNALGMTTYVLGSQGASSYNITIRINNYSGSAQTVPTQTVTIYLYTFESPFI